MRRMQVVGPLVCPVLVGRDDLLALAARRIEEAGAGRGHVLFLAGEAGVGKTRLLGSIERLAAASGFGSRAAARIRATSRFPGLSSSSSPAPMRRSDALAALRRADRGAPRQARRGARGRCASPSAAAHPRHRRRPRGRGVGADARRARGPPPGGRPDARGPRDRRATDHRGAAADRGDIPQRRALPTGADARLAGSAARPATGRGGAAPTAHARRDRDHGVAAPRVRPAAATRRRRGDPRPHRRHPPPRGGAHRADGRGGRRRPPGPGRVGGRPGRRRPARGPRHPRGRDPRPRRAPLAGRPAGRADRLGHRALVRARPARGRRGCRDREPRGARWPG